MLYKRSSFSCGTGERHGIKQLDLRGGVGGGGVVGYTVLTTTFVVRTVVVGAVKKDQRDENAKTMNKVTADTDKFWINVVVRTFIYSDKSFHSLLRLVIILLSHFV